MAISHIHNMKTVTYSDQSIRQLRRLPAGMRERVIAKVARYAASGAGDVKRLVGRSGQRLRIGDWRVIFAETETTIDVDSIGHRRDIYD